jgi:hypothetical protein
MKKSSIYWIITVILVIAIINEMILLEANITICTAVVINTWILMTITGFTALHYKHKGQ